MEESANNYDYQILLKMSFNTVVKEKIARTIGDFFTTNQIVNVFDDANIPTERELFAKWRIILDAFGKMSDQEDGIQHILKVFCHPLHFPDPQIRSNFIEKLNTILDYEDLKIRATNKGAEILTANGFPIDALPTETKKPVEEESKPEKRIRENREEENYYFENGMPHPGCSLELFIARKILHRKTRPNFPAKEFSFKQHSYAEICYVINSFIEKGIVSAYPNTTPEDLTYSYEECEELLGEDGQCGIKWSVVKRVEKDPKELKWAGFDFDIEDEVQLRGIIDIGISEFMNDKRYDQLGYLVDLASLSSNELTYEQQRGIVFKDIKENSRGEVLINISDYSHPKVNIVRTLLSLEREGVLRIKEFSWEYRKNPRIDNTDDDNIKDFRDKDEVYASVRLIQPISAVQEIKIVAMPEVPVRFVGNTPLAQSKKRESPIELPFPEPVQWEKVTLKIKDGRQEVEIFYNNDHIITADYIRLGFFVGSRQQKPDRQWGFLCALATLAATDIKQATAENMRSMITQDKTLSANNVQQVKKLFAERLQEIFKTSDDPFHNKREHYEPKFKILPEPTLRRETLWTQGGRLNENRGDETDRLTYEEKRAQEESEE